MPSSHALAGGTPEEEELRRQRGEFEKLVRELTELELALETLRVEVRAFDVRYLTLLGPRWAELHGIEAAMAELEAARRPSDQAARKRASVARDQAQATAGSVSDSVDSIPVTEERAPSPELKQLYREAARAVHPDLANDDREKAERTRVMAEVNAAYEAGDIQKLRDILRAWRLRPESVVGEDIGAQLIRIIRQIAGIRSRFSAIKTEMQALKATDLFRLMQDVKEASTRGVDLLAVLQNSLDAKIAVKGDELRRLREDVR